MPIKKFIEYLVFGKNPYKKDHNFALSITDKNAIYHCVLKAYSDLQLRTVKGLGNVGQDLKQTAKTNITKYLAKEIHTYLNSNNSEDFDSWHKNVCKNIAVNFYNTTNFVLPFGKTQKLVNMSFKYIFCLPDAQNNISKFKSCHMALDRVILAWYNENFQKADSCWSNISEGQYQKIQTDIRSYCNSKNTFPLLEEFDVWLKTKKQ